MTSEALLPSWQLCIHGFHCSRAEHILAPPAQGAIPTELLSNVVESWKDNTPCGTRAHNLRTRSPTPCPLGQGANADGAKQSSQTGVAWAETPYAWKSSKTCGGRAEGH